MRRTILLTATAASLVLLFAETARAVPAFARRYHLSCKTCHNPFPRLSEYGEDFAGNGFQLPDAEEPARSYVDVGDDRLALLRDFPVAARIDLPVRWEPDRTKAETDFRMVDRLKLLSGGALFRDIAYYFYFYMNEHGEVTGVEDAYLHFNNLGGVEVDLFAGQFQVSDPLFKRELRLTFEDYQIYKERIGGSAVNLAYDRGLMLTWSPRAGTDLALEVINGNGLGPEGEEGTFDDDSFKNVFGRLSQDLPGGIRLGALYYIGRQTTDEVRNETRIWGVDGTYAWKDVFTLNAQYIGREDDDPFFTGGEAPEVGTTGGFVEVVYAPKGADSRLYLTLLYNRVASDLDLHDYESATANASWLLLRNLRLFGEYSRDLEADADAVTAGLVAAF